jgi:hypothetical protein
MEVAHRRQNVGRFASAALPILWKAIARRDWTHSDFARAIGMSAANGTRLLYGDRGIGLEPALTIARLFPKCRPILWTKPCPPNWRPHAYEALRKARAPADDEGEPELAATGTDD